MLFFSSIFHFLSALPILGVCLLIAGTMGWVTLQGLKLVEQHSALPLSQTLARMPIDQLIWMAIPAGGSVALFSVAGWYAFRLPHRYRCMCRALHNPPALFPTH